MIRDGFEDYYLQQAGSGLPVFIGSRFQTGHGIGNLLGGLARIMVPVLRRGGKTLLREGLRTGVDVLGDVSRGGSLKSSLKKRAKQTGTRLANKAVNSLTAPPGRPNKKRKRQTKTSQSSKGRKRSRTNKNSDIFS